ncbi:MAG TPA: response regulator [Deltaproteobacteria bacterium]|nr:response regulator [Deltaproteobacteria bacterium]
MEAPPTLEEKTVLVIDDDEGECYLVEDILGEDGIKVDVAVGGEMGIRLMAERQYPVVITDLRMPDIDGMAVIDFIRKRRLNSLIVVITGYATIDSVIDALRAGAYDYIIKPFSADLLRFTIRKAFDYIIIREEQDRLKYFDKITQLAVTTAHEVFQPLTVLMGEANAIAKGTEDVAAAKEMAGSILTEARKIRDIIRKMEKLNEYVTKSFPGGHIILDIDKGSSGSD